MKFRCVPGYKLWKHSQLHSPFNQRRLPQFFSFAYLVALLDWHHFENVVLARVLMEVLESTSDFANSYEAMGQDVVLRR